MRTVTLWVTSKPAGGWRLIGLMTVYRLWARYRAPLSAARFGNLRRDYPATGQGMAADDATFDVASRCEATDGTRGDAVYCSVGDLEKGLEMARHRLAYEATVRHRFPILVPRLALNMHRGQRRIAWVSTASLSMCCDSGKAFFRVSDQTSVQYD